MRPGLLIKSSQVNTPPKAKSQAKDKRAKDRQEYTALRYKVGVAPPGFEVRRRMSRVAFRVFPAGRAGDTRAAICAISCFVSRFRVCVCVYVVLCRRSQAAQESEYSEPRPLFPGSFVGASISYLVGVVRKNLRPLSVRS